MTLTLITGWSVQLAALALLLGRVKRDWRVHVGAIFIILALIYHGLGEFLYRVFPDQNTYRLTFRTGRSRISSWQ